MLPRADGLRTFVITITRDDRAPMSIRNACHVLMIAVERNDQDLVEQSLADLQQIAGSEQYLLPVLEPYLKSRCSDRTPFSKSRRRDSARNRPPGDLPCPRLGGMLTR